MPRPNVRRTTAATLLAFTLGAVTAALTASRGEAASEPSPQRVEIPAGPPAGAALLGPPLPWDELEFSAHRFLLFAGRLALHRRDAAFDGDGPLRGKRVEVIETESSAWVLGRRFAQVRTRSTLDAATGATLAYEEEKAGEKLKRVTFEPDGYRERIYRATPGQEEAPPSSWPLDEDHLRPYRFRDGTPMPPGTVLRDYYAMIADLGRIDVKAGRPVEYVVPTRERLVRFRVEFGEREVRRLALDDLANGEVRERSVPVRRMTLVPLDEKPGEVGGFFAMQGGAEIWVTEETGVIVLIAGELPRAPGRTEIRLTAGRGAGGRTLREALGSPLAPR